MDETDKAFGEINRAISFLESEYANRYNGYASPYKNRETFGNLASFYRSAVSFMGGGRDKIGCDLGCWLGFPVHLETIDPQRHVYGIDIQQKFIDTANEWKRHIGSNSYSFIDMKDGIVPLLNESVDWVLINQVLCNSLPDTFERTVSEASRILKKGGTLLICDSNNPYHPSVLDRLKATYAAAEIGNGTPDNPNGYNYRARLGLIRKHAPDLPAAASADLARRTCYMWRPDILAALNDLQGNRLVSGSFFDAESESVPCMPETGAALGNVTNPYFIASIASRHGLRSTINVAMSRDQLPDHRIHDLLRQSGSFYVIASKEH